MHPQSFIPNTTGPGFIAEIDGIKDLPRMRGYETHSVIPTEYLIISIGSGGCLTIGIREDDYGSVWWADLDKADDDEIWDEPSESIMVRLASNWEDFLALEFDHL